MPKGNTLFAYFSKSPKADAAAKAVNGGASHSLNGQKCPKGAEGKRGTSSEAHSSKGGGAVASLHAVVWAKLEGHPYWPALVCGRSEGAPFVRAGPPPSVHVRFFDSPPSRAWVKLRLTKPFTGPRHPQVPAQLSRAGWAQGVAQAERALAMEPRERATLFPPHEEEQAGDGGSSESGDEDDEDEARGGPRPKRQRVSSGSSGGSSEEEFRPAPRELASESEEDSCSSGVDERSSSEEAPEPSPEKVLLPPLARASPPPCQQCVRGTQGTS